MFQKHHQVDGVVGDLAVDTDVAVVEHIGFGDGVGGVLQEIVQGGVLGVVLPGFDLQGQDLAGPLHEEVYLALLFAVEVVEVKAVGLQLLGGGVFVDGAEVDVLLPVQNFQLDAVHIHGREQAHIREEELEQIGRLCQQQGRDGVLDAVRRQGYPGVLQPEEAVAEAVELKVVVQVFQDETLVFRVQFAGDEVENILQIELILRVILSDVPFI